MSFSEEQIPQEVQMEMEELFFSLDDSNISDSLGGDLGGYSCFPAICSQQSPGMSFFLKLSMK